MELFGYTSETLRRRTSTRSSVRLHPDDRAAHRGGDRPRDRRAAATTRPTTASCTPTARVRWVAARGRVLCDPDGRAGADARRRLRHDRRPQRRRAPRPRAGDDEHGVHHARPRLALHLRQRRGRADPRPPPRRLVGRAICGRATRSSRAPRPSINYRGAMESGEPSSFEQYYPPLDAWFDVRATPSEDGLSVYFHDITDRVRAEQRARGGAGGRPARRPAGCRSSAAAGARLAGTLEVDELLRILADVVLNGFGEGVVVALDERSSRAGGARAAGDRIAARDAPTPRRRGCSAARWRPTAFGAGARAGLAERRELAATRSAPGRRSRCRWSRAGGMLGAMVVLGAVEARSTGACWSSSPRAPASRSTTRCSSAPSGGSRSTLQRSLLPTALPDAAGHRARRALPARRRRARRRRRLLPRPPARGRPRCCS